MEGFTKNIKTQLESFRDDNSVDKLKKKIVERERKHNIFNILKISRKEIRHSNFLAWLMNPKKTGELGEKILEEFFEKVKRKGGLENISIEELKFEGGEVRREYLKTDFWLTIPMKNTDKRVGCIIENKIDSHFENKLKGYTQEIKNHQYKESVCVAMAPWNKDFSKPKEYGYIPFYYVDILKILEAIDKSIVPERIKEAFKQYQETLKEKVIPIDREVRNLCEEILNKYDSNTIEKIYEYIELKREKLRKNVLDKRWTEALERMNEKINFFDREEWIGTSPKHGKPGPNRALNNKGEAKVSKLYQIAKKPWPGNPPGHSGREGVQFGIHLGLEELNKKSDMKILIRLYAHGGADYPISVKNYREELKEFIRRELPQYTVNGSSWLLGESEVNTLPKKSCVKNLVNGFKDLQNLSNKIDELSNTE